MTKEKKTTERMKVFRCTGSREGAFERFEADVNNWLRRNSNRVTIVDRKVSADGVGYPMVYIFYRS